MKQYRNLLITFVFIYFIMFVLSLLVTSSAEIHDGAIGRIQIPSIQADFDLSYSGNDHDAHQHIALLYKKQGCIHVGNHYASSGTWKMENVKIGDKAYLEYLTGDGCEIKYHSGVYVCYAVILCDTVDMILYHKGRELVFDPDDLICITCVWSDSTRNYIAVFEKI